MYIHAYHIDNVLNVYRKQLSQRTKIKGGGSPSPAPSLADKVNLSDEGQRQAIIKQVSEDIVKRVSKYSHENRLAETHGQPLEDALARGEITAPHKEAEFTYTVIDGNNDKKTHIMQLHKQGLLMKD